MIDPEKILQNILTDENYGEIINRTIVSLKIAASCIAEYDNPDDSKTAARQLLRAKSCMEEVLESVNEGEEQHYLLKLRELGVELCKIRRMFQSDEVAKYAFGDDLGKMGLSLGIDTQRIIDTIERTKSQIDRTRLEEMTKGLYALIPEQSFYKN